MLEIIGALGEFALVVLVALAAVLLKTIDGRGFLASVGVGLVIIYGGGLGWFVTVAVFFILGVVFTLYRYGYKKRLGGAQEKGGARNWPNILANGGAGSLFAVSQFFFPSPFFAALFIGSISTAAADTAATELGLLSQSRPRMVTRPSQVVPPGTSGGVSPLGFVGAVLASLIMGVMAFFLRVVPSLGFDLSGGLLVAGVSVVGGVAGSVADSVLGALVQRKGYCVVCLKPTEALRHCGEKTIVMKGSPFIENNVVNLLATLFGGGVSLSAFLLWTLAFP